MQSLLLGLSSCQSTIVHQDCDSEDSNQKELQPQASSKKKTTQRKQRKKLQTASNTWESQDYKEEWNDNNEHVWVDCDTSKF